MKQPNLAGESNATSEYTDHKEWTIESCIREAIRIKENVNPIMTWEHIYAVIDAWWVQSDFSSSYGDAYLARWKNFLDTHQRLYEEHFLPLLRQKYGNTETFLKSVIKFVPLPQIGQFSANDAVQGRDYIVRLNDWAYSIPQDATHWVVWTPHRLAPPEGSVVTGMIMDVGIAGFSGIKGRNKIIPPEGKEMEVIIQRIWPANEWEVCWFWNPPKLQSVPGASHFHAIVKPKT